MVVGGRTRAAALLLALGLFAAACGTRLSPEQRAAALGAPARAPGGVGQLATPDGTAGAEREPAADVAVTADAPAVTATPTAVPAVATPGAGPGAAPGAAPAAPAVSADGGGQPAAALRASDVGVSGTEIVIANVSDVTGPLPGLFESARQATVAYAAYTNSRGGVHGRQLRVLALDGRTDSGANRTATLEACEDAFALVGSLSAFDQGGAGAVDACGIPDVTALPLSAARATAQLTFAAYPNPPDTLILGPGRYAAERHPDAVRAAAMVYPDIEAARATAAKTIAGYESIGFEFTYEVATSVIETNYSPLVVEMRRRGVRYVTAVADYPNVARLVRAMEQQGYRPDVLDWTPSVYDPRFLELVGSAAEGSTLYLNTVPFEEIASNPELQRYQQWLGQVAPGARPTALGVYAWSAAALFVAAAETVGPELTRAALVEQLRATREWTGGGLHPAHDVGAKVQSPCFLIMTISGGRFARTEPGSGYRCDDLYRGPA